MRFFKKIILFYVVFFTVYVGACLYDQFARTDDFYPFSDWFLFSYVDQHGELNDLKLYHADGSSSRLSEKLTYNENRRLADDLGRAVRFYRNGQKEEAKALVSKVAAQHQVHGTVGLNVRHIERVEYYRENKWRHEEDVATFTF